MACHTVYYVLPQVQAAFPALSASGMAITGLGIAAVSIAAYLAIKDLKKEHAQAMAVFNERTAEYQANINEKNLAYTAQLNAALEIAEHTYQLAEQDALTEFIIHKFQNCSKRLTLVPDAPNDLVTRLQLLQNEFNKSGESEEMAQYICKLSDEIFNNTALPGHSMKTEIVLVEIELIKQDLILLPKKMQAEMSDSIDQYTAIADKQPQMVMQGITLLKARIFREIMLIKKREEEREECRKLINEALACISAMQKQEAIASYQQSASQYLEELQQLIQTGSNADIIREINNRIVNSYNECEATLQKLADDEYIRIKLVETLLSMGMNVPIREDDGTSIIAAIDSTVGIDFQIEDDKITTEMVALNDDINAMPDDVENGFAIADSIMENLSANGVPLREKYKKSHKHEHGHKLRTVKVTKTAEEATAKAETKKQMKMGE